MADGGGLFLPFGIKDQFTAPLKKMVEAVKNLTGELGKATQATGKNAKSINDATGATTKWNKELGKLAADGIKKLNSFNARNLYRTMRDMPVLALAVGEGLREGAKASMEFDRSLLDMTYSGKVGHDQIALLSSSAIELATRLKYNRNEVLQTETGFLQMGESAKRAAELTEMAAHFSTVMNVSLKDGADGLIRVSKLYNSSLNDLEGVSDYLAVTGKESRMSMEDLTTSLETLGPSATQAGMTLQQTTGLIRMLVDDGMSAAKATAALNQGMRFSARVGLDFNKALGEIRVNYEKIQDPMKRAAYLVSEFKLRSAGAFGMYFKDPKAMEKYIVDMNRAAGATKRMAAVYEANPGEKLAASLENLKDQFTFFASMITVPLGWILGAFNKLPQFIKMGATSFAMFLAGLSFFAKMLGPIKSGFAIFKGLGPVFGKILSPVLEMTARFSEFAPILSAVAGKFFGIVGLAMSLWDITRLLITGWKLISLKMERKGNDFLPEAQKKKLEERQAAGLIDAQGNLTSKGRGSFGGTTNNNSSASSVGMVLHGPVHIHMSGDTVMKNPKNLARTLQEEIRAAGTGK